MRVALYHNPNAGTQSFTGEDVAHLLRDAGYEVERFEKGAATVRDALRSRPDVLVAAGGDGTVAKVVTTVWKERANVPVFVLPMGTSNNIAYTLGLSDTVPQLIDGLAGARERSFDVGVVHATGKETPFVEAAGVGFFGASLRTDAPLRERFFHALTRWFRETLGGDALVREHARGVARRLRRARARRYSVVADGDDLSGDYVAVEMMNIRAIGPRVRLAPDADPADGMLDLILVRHEDREAIADLIEAQLPATDASIAVRRVRQVELSWPSTLGHVDAEPWPHDGNGDADQRMRVAARGKVRVLLPEGARQAR